MKKVPKFKNLLNKLVFCIVLITFTTNAFSFDTIEFAFDEDYPDKKTEKNLPSKIKARLKYDERPNKSDFFSRNDLGEAIGLQPEEELDGVWKGTYILDESSIKWINSKMRHHQVFNSIEFGEYDIALKFYVNEIGRIVSLKIGQDDFEYGEVNFQRADDKKLIYWTRATSKDWVEVIRGKLVRKSKDEIDTIFQTTVYDKNIPIYSFRGLAKLRK